MSTELPDGTTVQGTNRNPAFLKFATGAEIKARARHWQIMKQRRRGALRVAHHARNVAVRKANAIKRKAGSAAR